MNEEWDLADLLTGRNYPGDTVSVYLNEAASYTKVQLVKALANASTAEAVKIEKELKAVDELLEKSKYTVHLKAVPSSDREDIHSESLKKYPIKASMFGQDDTNNALARMKYENDLIWVAQIEAIENPEGKKNSGLGYTQVTAFARALPTAAQKAIDAKIKELTEASEEYTVAGVGVDFS